MKRILGIIKEILTTVIIAFAIYFVISIFVKVGVVDGESMEPTYQDGNYVVINRQARNFEDNDIIAFNYSEKEAKYYEELSNHQNEYQFNLHIKRILGIPGDEVEIKDNSLYINGEKESTASIPNLLIDQKYTLGEDEYFVQGDNIDDSFDSRMHGPVAKEDIFGKIIQFKK